MTEAADQFMDWLVTSNGYIAARTLPGDRWAAVTLMHSQMSSIITGPMLDYTTVSQRWDYEQLIPALAALEAWNGEGEPTGWIRHPTSGRRVSRTLGEYDEDGNLVPGVGITYVRY